jgi:DHA3 family tetracycline resistance protein-like MFS transporter
VATLFSEKDRLRRVTGSYYLTQGLYGLALGAILPAYVLFFWSRGLNLFEVAVLASVFEGSILFFEIPTGVLADIFGRRKSVICSHLFQSLAGLIFILSPSFWLFVVAEATQGFGETLKTGALEAWMVDNLKGVGEGERQSQTFARGEKFNRLGLLLGIIFGGFWGHHFLSLIFLPFTLFHLACGFSLLRYMPEYDRQSAEESGRPSSKLKETLTGGLKSITATKMALLLVIFSLFVAFAGETVDQYYQIYLSALFSLDPRHFGLMLIVASLVVILSVGGVMSKNLSLKGVPYLLGTIEAIKVVTILVFALSGNAVIAALAFIFLEVSKGWERPLLLDTINRYLPSAPRATAISFFSLVNSGGEVLAGPIIGAVALAFGLKGTFMTGAAVLALGLILFICASAITKGRGGNLLIPPGS